MLTSFLLITAVILWGLSFVATKICLEYLSPAEIIAARFILALPVLWIAARVRKLSFDFLRRHWKTALGCALVLVVHLLIQVEGMKTTTATNTAWLITTIPVFIVALSFIFLKERIAGRQLLGMAIAGIGVIILVSRGEITSLQFIKSYGDWLVLGSCITWSVYTILGKKMTGQPPLAITISTLALAAIVLVPPVAIDSGLAVYLSLPAPVLFSLLFLGVFCLGFSYWAWSEGLRRKSAGQVGVYLYLEPLSTMMAAPLILGESITPSLIGGGILVVVGVWMVQTWKYRPNGHKQLTASTGP